MGVPPLPGFEVSVTEAQRYLVTKNLQTGSPKGVTPFPLPRGWLFDPPEAADSMLPWELGLDYSIPLAELEELELNRIEVFRWYNCRKFHKRHCQCGNLSGWTHDDCEDPDCRCTATEEDFACCFDGESSALWRRLHKEAAMAKYQISRTSVEKPDNEIAYTKRQLNRLRDHSRPFSLTRLSIEELQHPVAYLPRL